MARQTGLIRFTGTIGNFTFYKMREAFFARRKSTLSGKRVKKDPVFQRTMQNANSFRIAVGLASQVYRPLPAAQKAKKFYNGLVGLAQTKLLAGMPHAVILEELAAHCAQRAVTP